MPVLTDEEAKAVYLSFKDQPSDLTLSLLDYDDKTFELACIEVLNGVETSDIIMIGRWLDWSNIHGREPQLLTWCEEEADLAVWMYWHRRDVLRRLEANYSTGRMRALLNQLYRQDEVMKPGWKKRLLSAFLNAGIWLKRIFLKFK